MSFRIPNNFPDSYKGLDKLRYPSFSIPGLF